MDIPKTRAEADQLLKRKCEIRAALDRIEARLNEKILHAKAEAEVEGARLVTEDAALEKALELWFAGERGKLPPNRRSLRLNFGRIGIRSREAVELIRGWTWETALIALKARGLSMFVRQREEIDKQALLGWGGPHDDEIQACGLRMERGEKFFVEPDVTRLEQDAAEPDPSRDRKGAVAKGAA